MLMLVRGWSGRRCDDAGSWLKRVEAVLRGKIGVVAGGGTMRLVRGWRRYDLAGSGTLAGGGMTRLDWGGSVRRRYDKDGLG